MSEKLTVAELLARNAKEGSGRSRRKAEEPRRHRDLEQGGISVSELTGDIPVVRVDEDGRPTGQDKVDKDSTARDARHGSAESESGSAASGSAVPQKPAQQSAQQPAAPKPVAQAPATPKPAASAAPVVPGSPNTVVAPDSALVPNRPTGGATRTVGADAEQTTVFRNVDSEAAAASAASAAVAGRPTAKAATPDEDVAAEDVAAGDAANVNTAAEATTGTRDDEYTESDADEYGESDGYEDYDEADDYEADGDRADGYDDSYDYDGDYEDNNDRDDYDRDDYDEDDYDEDEYDEEAPADGDDEAQDSADEIVEYEDDSISWPSLIGQAIGAVVLGVLIFFGFTVLWDHLNTVLVLIMALIVTLVVVGLVHTLLRHRDTLILALAFVVGLAITLGPRLIMSM
jgi:colicin import membrane protein